MSLRTLLLIGIAIGLATALAPPTNASGFANGCSVATTASPAPSVTTCTFLLCPANFIVGGTVTAVTGVGLVTITVSCNVEASCTTTVPGNCRVTTVNNAATTGTCTLTVLGEGVTAYGRCGMVGPAFPGGTGCAEQPVHTYGLGSSVGARSATANAGRGVGLVTVTDTNVNDCDGDGIGGDWDGDYDAGTGGGAFGYGPWAQDPDCGYDLNVHGPNVAVNDLVWGATVGFVVGEDDQGGPVKVQDPVTLEYTCTTDGSITPCAAAGPCPDPNDPTRDPDDCLSVRFVGTGATCGTGGGDGLYWVFLDGGRVEENGGSPSVNNAPTTGTITAF